MAELLTTAEDFIRVSDAQRCYFSGAMSLRWWYKQVELGTLPHFRAGCAVLLRPADIDAFVAAMFCDRKEAVEVVAPAATPPPAKPRSDGRGLRFFGN